MFVLTDQTQEIAAVAIEPRQERGVFTCLLPGPGQKLYHLPDVPEAIARLRDGVRFSMELTRYFRSRRDLREIDTIQGANYLKSMRDRDPGGW